MYIYIYISLSIYIYIHIAMSMQDLSTHARRATWVAGPQSSKREPSFSSQTSELGAATPSHPPPRGQDADCRRALRVPPLRRVPIGSGAERRRHRCEHQRVEPPVQHKQRDVARSDVGRNHDDDGAHDHHTDDDEHRHADPRGRADDGARDHDDDEHDNANPRGPEYDKYDEYDEYDEHDYDDEHH